MPRSTQCSQFLPLAKLLGSAEESEFQWLVTSQQFSLQQSNVFFLALSPSGAVSLEGASTSHYFNLTAASEATPSSSTSALNSGVPSPTKTDAASTGSQSPPSQSTGSPPAQAATSSSTTSTTTIGIGVGLGLGIPLLLLVIYILSPRQYRRKFFAKKSRSNADIVDQGRPHAVTVVPNKNFVGEMTGNEQNYHFPTDTRADNAPVKIPAVELHA
jgi:hypothetical protein